MGRVFCHHCQKVQDFSEPLGRRDTCNHCGWDLHVCYNCQFYDAKSYNECREPQAERVLEKAKSNFCDYFKAVSAGGVGSAREENEAKEKLEALFKKKKD